MTSMTGPAEDTPPPGETAPREMFFADVARAAGTEPISIARYHQDAQAARRRAERIAAGQPRPADLKPKARLPQERDMPVPDGWGYPPGRTSGAKSPWWWPETLAPWLAVRQGPGKPPSAGGKPRQIKALRAKPGPKRRRRAAPKAPAAPDPAGDGA